MATTVVKKDGSIQPFDIEKIKGAVRGAATEAGLDATAVEEIVAKVSEPVLAALAAKDQVASSEIKDLIFAQLQMLNPLVIEAWNKHATEKTQPPASQPAA
jgi:transcriptional regulator NrdR family protein